jgi:hypothetical protein
LRVPFQAPAVATKGHFYEVSEAVQDQLAIIRDRKGNHIKPNASTDETVIGIE